MVGLFPSTSSSRSQIETEMEFIERECVVRETSPERRWTQKLSVLVKWRAVKEFYYIYTSGEVLFF